MKTRFTLFALILIFEAANVYCQNDWRLLTVSRNLTSINFISPKKAWLFGGDFFYKSTDNGGNWSMPLKAVFPINPIDNRKTLCFIDSLYGWAITELYPITVVKTVNGGEQWNQVSINVPFSTYGSIYFINRNTGWLTGSYNSVGQIAKTSNGGINWIVVNSNPVIVTQQIYMVNENRGYLLWRLDTIAITTNSGYNWTYQKVGNGQPLREIYFLDSLKGWLIGNLSYVCKTTNGGINWNYIPTPIGNPGNAFFVDSLNGWIIGVSGNRPLWKTTNGGFNWTNTMNWGPEHPADIYFKNVNTGWLSFENGHLLMTTNNGNNWVNQISQPLGSIISIDFCDMNIGYAISYYAKSYIWKTTNRGYNWFEVNSYNSTSLTSIEFIDCNTGYVCGDAGKISKTTNAGVNFTEINHGTANYNSVSFLNTNTGFICGNGGSIIKTTNGGLNWINLQTNTTKKLNSISTVDLQNIYVAADSGYILKTINSGQNWNLLYPYNFKHYNKIQFIDNNTGFATGKSTYTGHPPRAYLVLIKTTNGGLNWTTLLNEDLYLTNNYNDIFFLNNGIGWLLTTSGLMKTTNSGSNWFSQQLTISQGLTCMKFLNESVGWLGGERSIILTTSSPIGIQTVNSEIPNNFHLKQNYPNPFNPQTKIKFAVPKASFTKLIIYDLLGKEVVTLVSEELKPGTYEAEWDGSNYSSGIFFYKLEAGDFTETKKMVLMK